MSSTPVLPAPGQTTKGDEQLSNPVWRGAARPRSVPPRRRAHRARPQLASLGQDNWPARFGASSWGQSGSVSSCSPSITWSSPASVRKPNTFRPMRGCPRTGCRCRPGPRSFDRDRALAHFLNSVIYAARTILVVATLSLVAAFRIVQRGSRFFGGVLPAYSLRAGRAHPGHHHPDLRHHIENAPL